MTRRPTAPVLAFLLALSVLPASHAAVAAATCDPFQTPAEYGGTVPTAESVLGFALGSQQVTVDQSNTYLAAVDAASDRVISGTAATSVGGQAIRYAIVGTPTRVSPTGLAAAQAAVRTLQDPLATPAAVEAALAAAPAMLWIAANVHGTEESGADAALQALYELADRGTASSTRSSTTRWSCSCRSRTRTAATEQTRRNLYGFDMNRDWFARTQPETDGKLEVIRQYPPMLFIDAHEFGLSDYFFPPNADPEYHETPDTAHDWINGLYSPAIAGQFDREGIKYFHGAPYDFFATLFGDTVPAVGFHAAGMTFEKEDGDAIAVREHEHFTSMWASLYAGASQRPALLAAWHDSWVEAYQEGVAGSLEPNAVFEPRHDLYQPVPAQTIRGYFLRDDPNRAGELQLLIRRLQRMDVQVRRLTAPLVLTDFHPYGDPPAAATLPTGTYWIPMAQAQKHWIQAMLHEDPWIPFEVTYDVTAWSNPLLMNLSGGWSGQAVTPVSTIVAPIAALTPPTLPSGVPSIGLFEIPNSTRGFEAAGQARWLFEQVWHLPYHAVTAADIVAGLVGTNVLVIPDGYANYGVQALGSKGKRALRDWVNTGGRIVAWQGGVEVAVKTGVSTVKLGGSHTNAPGTLIRVAVDGASPVATGIGSRDWIMYQDDKTMKPGLGTSVATYPAAGQPAFATSGLAIGVDGLAGTSAVVDEAVGAGRVVAFASDPNFRGWTQGTQRLLWNALLGGPAAGARTGLLAGSRERAAAEKAAQDAAATLPDVGSAIRIRVRAVDAAATVKILKSPRRDRGPPGPRHADAVPGRQQEGPDVRGASLVRTDRARPRQGGHQRDRGERAVGRTGRTTGSLDPDDEPALSCPELALCIGSMH